MIKLLSVHERFSNGKLQQAYEIFCIGCSAVKWATSKFPSASVSKQLFIIANHSTEHASPVYSFSSKSKSFLLKKFWPNLEIALWMGVAVQINSP